ncbi:MAG: hypothetical protein EA397_13070 [Deltaproteobacteria bacterium]|nr:MAG: hypothetical protein EA397_13070 [Deltaproteobacteria bacterium]
MISLFVAVLLGALCWTLLEYVIHRFLGHHRWFRGNPFGVEHLRHHAIEGYFGPATKKALAALPVAALTWALGAWIAGPLLGLAYTSGLMGTYLVYELLHRREHTCAGLGAYGRWARRHHFWHHFGNASKNHGVTTPVWDLVFGTYERPRQIVVPARRAPAWMLDPDTGALREELQDSYRLRGRISAR